MVRTANRKIAERDRKIANLERRVEELKAGWATVDEVSRKVVSTSFILFLESHTSTFFVMV
jgi:hypothetical protein